MATVQTIVRFGYRLFLSQNMYSRALRKYLIMLTVVLCFAILMKVGSLYYRSSNSTKDKTQPTKIFVNKCPCELLNLLSPPINNFVHFPCLQNHTPSEDLLQNGNCVRTVNLPLSLLVDPHGCVLLKYGRGTPICTYPVEEDIHVSNALVSRGYWEEDLIFPMLNIFKERRNLVLLDLGCNIGVYTLSVALYTNKVYCIDANFENLYLVSKSLTQGKLHDNVTLIWNAVSDKHKTVILRKQTENVGGAEIDAWNKTLSGCDIKVNTIILDDLKDKFVDQEVYMKLDVQSEEHRVLRHGREFFRTAKVINVQLEYVMHVGRTSGREIISIMTEYGYQAYADCEGKNILDPALENTWPNDVCFLPKK